VNAERLGSAFDLLAAYGPGAGVYFERAGLGVAGGPPIERVAPADAQGRLRQLWPSDGVAAGALPCWDDPNALLSIPDPAVTRRVAGPALRTALQDTLPEPIRPVAGGSPSSPFTAPQRHDLPSADVYARSVGAAIERIDAGDLRKVVLARIVEIEAGRELDPRRLAHRLRAVDPAAYAFAMPTERGVLVGASPELLVSRSGTTVRSNPLAGSAARSGDPDEDRALGEALAASAKDREEHAIVVDAIASALRPFCRDLRWDREPVLLATPNVWHLSTRFEGELREPAPNVVDLMAILHPTPAIAGTPTREAVALIRELEPFERGAYAGPVGWIDADGDGVWAIALRCAELVGARAILAAGAGIVSGSRPEGEVEETERKFRAFLDALRWG
jgi:isochorismate synthase